MDCVALGLPISYPCPQERISVRRRNARGRADWLSWSRSLSAIIILSLGFLFQTGHGLHAQSTGPGSQRQPQIGSLNETADAGIQTGISLTRQGRFKEAIPYLKTAREQGDHSFALEFDLSLCYVGTEQYGPAVEILSKLSAANPRNANVFSLLAQAYVGSDKIDDAVRALHTAAALSPKNEKLYLLLADACMERSQYSLGLDVANLGLKNLPRSPGLLYQRGMFLTLLDQFDTGKLDLERASELGQGNLVAFLAAAQKASFEGDMTAVARIAREGAKKYESEALLTMLGEALIRSGVKPEQPEFGEAVAALEKAVSIRSDSLPSRLALGKLYLMSSRVQDAIVQLEAARQLDPSNTGVYLQLAKAYRRNGDPAKAQEMLAILSKLNLQQADNIRSAPGERKSSYLSSRPETGRQSGSTRPSGQPPEENR